MISYVKGELDSTEQDKIIVDVGGVGYGVFMSAQSISRLGPVGTEIKVYTYLNVKEDMMQLYGFLTKDDLKIFRLVIGVSGIGPKGGLNLLSQLTPDELRLAVLSNDAKAIAKAPGIGKKTAEKLIIELKDKLKLEDVLESFQVPDESDEGTGTGIETEAMLALTALGYGSSEAMRAVKKVAVTDAMPVEEVLKQALKYII